MLATPPIGAQTAAGDSTWRDHNAAARAAYERKDYATYRAQLLQLASALSGHSLVLYKLAASEALLGNDTAAIRRLRVYAATGLTAQVASDTDFISLRGRADFDSVVAQLTRNARPITTSELAFTLPDPRILPEDMTYDAAGRAFYVSSMLERKIVRIEASGATRDFVTSGRDGVWSILGLAVDKHRRLLWATTSTLERTRGFAPADSGRGALLAYDLANGRLVHRYDLPASSGHHELGEVAVSDSGDVYVSDGRVGVLYVLRSDASALEPLLADGALVSPQGIVVRPDGRLFVADYVRGVAIVEPMMRTVSWLPHPHEVPLNGIDGLALRGHTLVAIQNGTTPPRVLRLELDDDMGRVMRSEVLEANSAGSSEPTHGVFVGDDFYFIANSGFGRLADDGRVKSGVALERGMIRRARIQSEAGDAPAAPTGLAQPAGAFFALSVKDVNRMAGWYRSRLGFGTVKEGTVVLDSVRVRYALLEGEGTVVEMIERSDARPLSALAPRGLEAHQVHGFFKAGLHVRDVEALRDTLRARGVDFVYQLARAKDFPLRSFTVRDPEGNLLQFFGSELPSTVTACPPPVIPQSSAVSLTSGVVFSIRGADTLRLDIARPARVSSRVPVVLLVHGGGWSGGDRSSRLGEQMRRLAGMGYGAVSVDYRLVSSGRNVFPAAAQDVVCAARWVRAHGGEHGLDGARIVVVGESSGGELAGLLGTAAERADLNATCESEPPAAVRGVIAMYGALDLRVPLGPDSAVGRLVASYLGGEPAALPDIARRASPAALVHSGMPPFLLIHGADDASVSPSQSRSMRDALRGAGVPVTYLEVPGQVHGFPMLSDDPALRTSTCTVAAFLDRVLR